MGEKLCEESEQKIWQALELAGIKQIIDNLPRKLDTVLTIFHIIGSIKVEVFIFLEHIWWIEFKCR